MLKRFFKSKRGATNTTEIPMWVVVIVIAVAIVGVGIGTHLSTLAASAGTQMSTSENNAATNAALIKQP